MTMTAISKGFLRIMKLLSEYGNRQERHNTLDIWTNDDQTTKTDQQKNVENLGNSLIYSLTILFKFFFFYHLPAMHVGRYLK